MVLFARCGRSVATSVKCDSAPDAVEGAPLPFVAYGKEALLAVGVVQYLLLYVGMKHLLAEMLVVNSITNSITSTDGRSGTGHAIVIHHEAAAEIAGRVQIQHD